MAERKPVKDPGDKDKDFKTPIVETADFPEKEPAATPTVTVKVEDADGNVLVEHVGVAAAFLHVMKVDDKGEVTMNAGAVYADEEDLADTVEFMGEHIPEWLKAHPGVSEIIASRLPEAPKVV